MKNKYGQYMTPSLICDFMVKLIGHSNNSLILEPCCGDGAFINALQKNNFTNLFAYEIDSSLTKNITNVTINNSSFISSNPKNLYDVIIGNPPYIRWKNLETNLKEELKSFDTWNKTCNSLCDYSSAFIIKSVLQLKENGELIFITPEYWFSTTHSKNLRSFLLKNGYFSDIFYFNETPIFSKVNVSLVIFKFIKSSKINQNSNSLLKQISLPKINITKLKSKTKLTTQFFVDLLALKNSEQIQTFTIPQFNLNSQFLLTDEKTKNQLELFESKCKCKTLNDVCFIANGMVSGLDKAFKLTEEQFNSLNDKEKISTIDVIKSKNINPFYYKKISKYIFLPELSEQELQKDYPNFFNKLTKLKNELNNRYNYGKTINFWQWSFLRNYNLFVTPKERIFVPCKERITKKNRLRFCYSQKNIFPTQDVTCIIKKENTKEDLLYILAFLNSKYVFNWLLIKGIKKGDILEFSKRPVSSIPYKEINFNAPTENELYNQIIFYTKDYINTHNDISLQKIDNLFDKLFCN